ncbi:uncharacterized protein BJ171DRAFT_571005 [Polychytrium aggregatum]|uniref:uncharacterized protein n=1 Tax=Polychytrium aggregatum TaxID=110093 RepID=UPI0022FDD635|nr:uncharacterized protein BJ171DRAFT_571005 [Polychytrium aggregatum]KAI9197224.1 hypothetical protein BJ171DRAFT_571005 [Polychytrium aggregatum]
MAQLAIDEHSPDIFAIVCFNDSFQLALSFDDIKTLLLVCKRARPLLSSKVPRFHRWCQKAGLCRPDGGLRIGLTHSHEIAISLHCDEQVTIDRSWLVAQADKGNAAASYFLAIILQIGVGGRPYRNRSKQQAIHQQIFRHLKNATNANDTMAQFHLAGCYHDGTGVDQDHTKAVELYRNLAERGLSQAQIALGCCFEGGEGVDQDFDTAIKWYSKASDQSSEDGRLYIVFLRAWFSFIGHGVEQSDENALNHWQEVSTQSTDPVIKPIATHMVGWMHYLGRGSQRDQLKGITIIRKNESDEFNLGENECLTSIWKDIKSDSPVACKFFQLCQLGSDRDWICRHLVAVCLFYGFGTTEDRVKAAGMFEQLANEGHSDSQLWIGECYHWSVGVSEDNDNAFEWFSKSADQGNSYGQWMVGECYYNGHGVAEDLAKAAEWYRKSAEQGNRYGQHDLGNCYRYGDGVPKDIDTAVFWYHKSADQGFEYAINGLKRLGKWP